MKRSIRIVAHARRDLGRLEAFLIGKNPRAAKQAAAAIVSAIFSLEEFAERCPRLADSEIRELVVSYGRDGYVVHYRIDGQLIHVARIFHGKEDR